MSDQLKVPPKHPSEILLLTLVAGGADALGYLNLGKVFTSNMTGNVVLMGIALAEGRGADTGRSLFAFLAFIVGNGLGAFLCSRFFRKEAPASIITAVFSLEAALLLAFAGSSPLLSPQRQTDMAYPLIALLGASMGLQAAAVYRMGTPGVTTTAITGTLTTLLTGLMKPISTLPKTSTGTPANPSAFGLQALVILTYCGGAAISGLLRLHAPIWAGFFPPAMVAIVIVTRLVRRN
jgi:uncharacterized membrane protein YoaK (UPF0700 family)